MDISTYEVQEDPFQGAIEIDALIYPAIQELNRKGYITSACCCGHEKDFLLGDSCCAYIQFDFGEITPENLPDGWHWIDHGQQMEYEYSRQDGAGIQQEINMVMSRLAVWAAELPDTRQ